MELDDLKRAWDVENPKIEYTKATLKDIFEIRTKRAVSNINKSMLWDAILMITATAGFIVITFALGLKSRFMISGELALIATILSIHYRIKYLTINNFNFEDSGMGTAIRKVIKRLKGYIILYKILIPVLSAGLYLLYNVNAHYYITGVYSFDAFSGMDVVVTMLIAIVSYLLIYGTTYFMYTGELRRLEKFCEELEVV